MGLLAVVFLAMGARVLLCLIVLVLLFFLVLASLGLLGFLVVDSGDTTTLHAVAMASVLRAYLYCIYNFRFQQVEVPVQYLEQHCVLRSV